MKAISAILFALSPVLPSYAEPLSIRQALVAAPEIESVVPIGRTVTLVSQGGRSLFGMSAAPEASFEQALANLCSSKWMFSRSHVDPIDEHGTKVEELLAPKDAASEIFRVGGTECQNQFRVRTGVRAAMMGATPLVAIRSFGEEVLIWKGRVKALYEGDSLPANGMITGKSLGFSRAKINGLESLAWAYARCVQGQGTLALYQPGSGRILDEERMFTLLAFSYEDPYETHGRYLETPYFLGCTGPRSFILKVSKGQGMLFEAGRDLGAMR